ncbi:MAG: ribonuclease HII [Verrucomicrobiales bacterium]|nr:ribonuclease HII [Verrucomicrobiales bacterium]
MPDLSFENQLRTEGFPVVAGIDEAGRGPLAGPVSVAAVIVPVDFHHKVLTDSKKLSEKNRDLLYEEITTHPDIFYSSVMIDSKTIDEINILQATWKGMADAFAGLSIAADIALIDGKPVKNFPGKHKALVKGDSLSLSIAAASIIAKVERDRLMKKYAEKFPQYHFERHKGYGTRLHLEALREHGPCEIHRMSFAPVANAAINKKS